MMKTLKSIKRKIPISKIGAIKINFRQVVVLPNDPRKKVEKLFVEECKVFLKHENDISCTESLKRTFKDNTPASQPYPKILKQLYNEPKHYLEDLLTNQWIKKVLFLLLQCHVCIRKQDGTISLCIAYQEFNKQILPDKIPLSRIQNILDNLGCQKYFTKLDPRQPSKEPSGVSK